MYVYKKITLGYLLNGLPVSGFKLLGKIEDTNLCKVVVEDDTEDSINTFVTNFKLPREWNDTSKIKDTIKISDDYFLNLFSIEEVNEDYIDKNYIYLIGKDSIGNTHNFKLYDDEGEMIKIEKLDNIPTMELLDYYGRKLGYMVLFNLFICKEGERL